MPVLQGDVAASKELYDALRRKLQQATVDAEVGGLNTVLVQRRARTHGAGRPEKYLYSVGQLDSGPLCWSGCGALYSRGVSDRVREPQHIERALGLPVLARISGVFKDIDMTELHGGLEARRVPMVLAAPSSIALRGDPRIAQLSGACQGHVKTVLVTSGNARRGRPSSFCKSGILLARSGARVLLVDTDLQKPRIQDEFDIDNGPGLAEYLAGESFVPTPIQPLPRLQNLFMITGGHATSTSSEPLSSAIFRSLLLKWKKRI